MAQTSRRKIFVYGANTQGRHGKGAAKDAVEKYGAQYGKVGLVGNSYGVITKELRPGFPKINLEFIKSEVDKLIDVCYDNPELEFVCTPFGTGLAGFTHEQMKEIFAQYLFLPDNLILPEEWKEDERIRYSQHGA